MFAKKEIIWSMALSIHTQNHLCNKLEKFFFLFNYLLQIKYVRINIALSEAHFDNLFVSAAALMYCVFSMAVCVCCA